MFKSVLGLSQDKNNNKSAANRQFFMILAVIKLVIESEANIKVYFFLKIS
jgi:hypothetical protein